MGDDVRDTERIRDTKPFPPCGWNRHVHPNWDSSLRTATLTGNARWLINYGSDEDPEWFTCCEVHKLRARPNDLDNAIPAKMALYSMTPRPWRWVFALDEWQHIYGKRFGDSGLARWLWDSIWRPLCDLNEWYWTSGDDR